MKRNIISTVLTLALMTSSPALAADATLIDLSGTVEVVASGSDKAQAAVKDQLLKEGTKIKTAAASSATIKLDDGTTIDMQENSQMMISSYTQKAAKKNSVLLFFGSIWSKVTKSFNGKESFQVNTPNAVAGVRGTEFVTTVADDGSVRVKVTAGVVGVGAADSNGAEVRAEQQIDSNEKGISAVTKAGSAEDDAQWRQSGRDRMQKDGKKISAVMKNKIMAQKSELEKINKQLKRLMNQKKSLESQAKMGNPSAKTKLKDLNNEIERLQIRKAALNDQAQSQFGLFDRFVALANDPVFAMAGAAAIKADAVALYNVKKQFDEMAAYGMDLSMEAMDDMLEEYSNGARGTLKEKSGSAADELFAPTPGQTKF